MTKLCLEKFKGTHEMIVSFANTGAESQKTLDFVKQCDDHFGFNTVWIEADIGPAGKGVRHTVVDYETASRNAEPFWKAVKKHGIYNQSYSSCTARLKVEPMESYLRTQGFTFGKHKNHQTAIGIRLDEMDRMSALAERDHLIYPLVTWGWTKPLVLAECGKWPFDLDLDEHYGNCTWCYRKSLRKLLTIAADNPSLFDTPAAMEQRDAANPHRESGPAVMYRGHLGAKDIIAMSKRPFRRFVPDEGQISLFGPDSYDELLDAAGDCNESCEVYQ